MTTPLHPEALSWTALLGRWMDFARASLALPPTAEGDRWRESVASIISLQAVTFALADLGRVAPAERPLALDRAEVLIDRDAAALERTWDGEVPALVGELIGDARAALRSAAPP